jgi:hypothetical protein
MRVKVEKYFSINYSFNLNKTDIPKAFKQLSTGKFKHRSVFLS